MAVRFGLLVTLEVGADLLAREPEIRPVEIAAAL